MVSGVELMVDGFGVSGGITCKMLDSVCGSQLKLISPM